MGQHKQRRTKASDRSRSVTARMALDEARRILAENERHEPGECFASGCVVDMVAERDYPEALAALRDGLRSFVGETAPREQQAHRRQTRKLSRSKEDAHRRELLGLNLKPVEEPK